MPKLSRFTPEFKAQAVRLVFESMKPIDSRKEACRRLAPKVTVKEVALYNWVKEATAPTAAASPRRVRSRSCMALIATSRSDPARRPRRG